MHDWEHDQTNKGTYEPQDTEGRFDHSQCVMVCKECGFEWGCRYLFPKSRICEQTNDNENV